MDRIRVFIALNLSASTRENLASAASGAPGADRIRWVKPENLHLTIRFLGEVASGRLDSIGEAVRCAVRPHHAPEFTVRGLGAFPDRGLPRVIWAGVDEVRPVLVGLHDSLDRALEREGFEREGRAYAPHITLGRVRSKPRSDRRGGAGWSAGLRRYLEARVALAFGEEAIDAISVMKSELGPRGPRYEELSRIPIGA